MKKQSYFIFTIFIITQFFACKSNKQSDARVAEEWIIDSQKDWQENITAQANLKIEEGKLEPLDSVVTFQSILKKFDKKRSLKSIAFSQSPVWLNWQPVKNIGPSNLGDAPVALRLGDGNYWMFGRYQKHKSQKNGEFQSQSIRLEGFENIDLKTTPFENQYDAPGGLMPGKGGYHAWQSRDMVNWVHHGPVSEKFSKWVTSAEYADGKLFLYYDFPNDQDPHVYVDEDLTDGIPGRNMGMAFNDPSDGSDCAVIRDLNGDFHIIAEDWSPINASTHAWDSPLAVRAVSSDGVNDFTIVNYPVDERTEGTGEFAEYAHPHWHAEAPDRFPGKASPVDVPQHRIKANDIRAYGKYEIHKPEQNAYGDWAAISIGGQEYLFCDFDPAGSHGREGMSVAWFTSEDINEPFTFCGNIGQGHPDPDIMFAEGQFYLVTQLQTDYVSSGPWVESVEVRVGVDTSNDGVIDEWSKWQKVTEQYDYIDGFAKQVERIPAKFDGALLPEGFGFQFEVEIEDSTENESKPILDKVVFEFEN